MSPKLENDVNVSCFFLYFKEAGAGGVTVVWETMLGRHVTFKPGNGRKRKRAVWPPLSHLLRDTGSQETGRGVGYGGSVGRKRWKM